MSGDTRRRVGGDTFRRVGEQRIGVGFPSCFFRSASDLGTLNPLYTPTRYVSPDPSNFVPISNPFPLYTSDKRDPNPAIAASGC
jgi:hypothetical protein